MILQRIRIIVEDVWFEPGTSAAPEVCQWATKSPRHKAKMFYDWQITSDIVLHSLPCRHKGFFCEIIFVIFLQFIILVFLIREENL